MPPAPPIPSPPRDAWDLRDRIERAVRIDPRIVGLTDYGSRSEGRDDVFSDVDVGIIVRDDDYVAFERDWVAWAASFGPLLLSFVGDIDNHWVVYEGERFPLRADLSLHRSSAITMATVDEWPNAPTSVASMLLVDKRGDLGDIVAAMVGQDLGPPDPPRRCELVIAGFWYYAVRTWCKLQRAPDWGVRFDIGFIMHGNLLAILRLEAGAVSRWRASDAAANIERDIGTDRLAALRLCIPDSNDASLAPALAAIIRLGQSASAGAAGRYGCAWPEDLADRMVILTSDTES